MLVYVCVFMKSTFNDYKNILISITHMIIKGCINMLSTYNFENTQYTLYY